MSKFIFIPVHLLAFVVSTLYKSKPLSFYSVFSTIAQNNFLHLLHTSLIVHFLFYSIFSISDAALGTLTESEAIIYSEKMYAMLGDIVLVISSFSNDLDMRVFLYFCLFYALKSVSWTFTIKAQRTANTNMLLGGITIIALSILSMLFCIFPLQLTVSITSLFALEYALITLEMLRTLIIMLIDLRQTDKGRTMAIFIISIFYYLFKALAYMLFTVIVTIKHKLPMNTARACVSSLIKLCKKTKLFLAYLKLSRDLDSVKDVQINGTCAICTDDLTVGKILKCKHAFHAECLKMWCERETTCPICRAELVFKRERLIETESEIISGVPIDNE